jgi:hypothetical protein
MDRITEESDNYTAIVAAFNSTTDSNPRSASKSPVAAKSQSVSKKELRLARTSRLVSPVRAPNTPLPCAANGSTSIRVGSNFESKAQGLSVRNMYRYEP